MSQLRTNKHRRPRRRGSIAVLVAVSLTAVVAILAIALDGGMLLDDRRMSQATADVASLAAASQLYLDYPQAAGFDVNGLARKRAIDIVAQNVGADAVAIVNIPPKSGTFAGQAGYVEVIVNLEQNRFFSGLFGSGNIPISSRSVARGQWENIQASLIMLEPKRGKGLEVKKNSVLTVDGDIIVNSKNKHAAKVDSSSTVSGNNIYVTGGAQGNFSGDLKTGEAPTPDPLRDLAPPDPNDFPVRNAPKSSKKKKGKKGKKGDGITIEIYPGRYTEEIKIENNDTLIMHPGTYYLERGLKLRKDATLIGKEVTIFNGGNTSGKGKHSRGRQIRIEGGSTINLTPPNSGPYAGISIFQDRHNKKTIEFRQRTNVNIGGTIYAPNAKVHFRTSYVEIGDDDDFDFDDYYDQYDDDGNDDDENELGDDDEGSDIGQKFSGQIIARRLKLDKRATLDLRGVSTSSRTRKLQLVE